MYLSVVGILHYLFTYCYLQTNTLLIKKLIKKYLIVRNTKHCMTLWPWWLGKCLSTCSWLTHPRPYIPIENRGWEYHLTFQRHKHWTLSKDIIPFFPLPKFSLDTFPASSQQKWMLLSKFIHRTFIIWKSLLLLKYINFSHGFWW